MIKKLGCAIMILLIGLPISALASVSTKPSYPSSSTLEKITQNGKYLVYVQNDKKWIEVGSLSFDKFFREKTINLNRHLNESSAIKIRLVQRGGGAAHIDSVFLGGLSAYEINDSDLNYGIEKLSKRDFDVIDAFGRSLELSFPKNIQNGTLSITARVENERIGKTPFQFPLTNLFKRMNPEVEFLQYPLDSGKTSSQKSPDPFFKEFCRTGSGHPFGFTYGWVWSDDVNLYVDIDFTPDNTMDGVKDYAKVYVNTKDDLKEFKVSVGETRWGHPDFKYTDKVDYQHKFYHFRIPLSEIGTYNGSIALAFAAYGTANPGCYNDADCDDGQFCNGLETCNSYMSECDLGTPPDCDDGVGCTVDSCDEFNDACVNAPDDAFCDDNNFCNGIETCDSVDDCQPGTPPVCDDAYSCTTDSCDPQIGCAYVPVVCPVGQQCDPDDGSCKPEAECTVDADCNDGSFCNGTETCDTATDICLPGVPPDCGDSVACTVDSCDEVNDACANTPDNASCDDNDVCTGTELCDPRLDCEDGAPLDCDDGNLCTTDSCDPLTGCANVPVECPAGKQCDQADGLCKAPPECTVDADCDDGMFCNGSETCDTATGICQAGMQPDCDDWVDCTLDTCDEVNDACVNTPDNVTCDDGMFCTGVERCDPLDDCQSMGDPCPENNICNEDTDTCEPVGSVTICHIPPGRSDKARTISVGAASVPAHLAHGDSLGPCP